MTTLTGCGLGLRREFLQEASKSIFKPDFWEITPENWIYMPYHHKDAFEKIAFGNKIVAHGVSLSIGSDKKPSKKFILQLKEFLDRYEIKEYSEHISFSAHNFSQSYELLPLPLTKKMLNKLCNRIEYTQEMLKRELILENATYYYLPQKEMDEADFINTLMKKSGAKLLLDVNNVFVNSVNHHFNAYDFINAIDLSCVSYIHVAGHFNDKASGFLIDTHGKNVSKKVWELVAYALQKRKLPTMIERDNNIPKLQELIKEYEHLQSIYKEAS